MKANKNNVVPPSRLVPLPYVIAGHAKQSHTKVTTPHRDCGACSEYQRRIPTEIASARACLTMTGRGTLALTLSLLQSE